ncbi:general stress protein [Planococcus salinus]|uniref:General stress protein 17M-like domain-containing protein n=1 Tax=Planococcus salinus TaxID=1848460 RepID=A0A3M8P3C4_9BACL|nr:general stress protein [Planococcus salinus]RNF38207.1 hypothetical protein EEX84_15795 [Planococcus salinus]
MKSTNRDFEVVYTLDELEQKVEEMKLRGYKEKDIHVLANDNDVLGAAESQTNVQTHEAGTFTEKFKSFFTGKDAVREELERLDLEESTIEGLHRELDNGGILLYTDHQPIEREDENFTSFGDDTRTVDLDEEKRNTAFAPFGRDIERDGRKFNDENIRDEDVRIPPERVENDSDEIYTRDAAREEQHGESGQHDKFKDSRTDGENIHPTTGSNHPKDEGAPGEQYMDHEPNVETPEGERNLNREDGVNKRQDEPSPGVDPNLGPAPFGRDSEEEHLANTERDDYDPPRNPRDHRDFHNDVEKKRGTPPTPRLF